MANDIELGELETVSVSGSSAEERLKNVPSMYSNQVYIASTPWDIQMLFGNLKTLSVGNATVEPLANIVMSPGHAKAFSQILRQQILNYEARYGPIVLNLAAAAATKPDQPETPQETDQPKTTSKRRRKKLT